MTKRSKGGIAAVSIDGGPETFIDEYAAHDAGDVLVYTSPVPTAGTHALKVRNTGMHNAAGSGARIYIDRVDLINSGPECLLPDFDQLGIDRGRPRVRPRPRPPRCGPVGRPAVERGDPRRRPIPLRRRWRRQRL